MITDEDIKILIGRFREIFYDKQESEEMMRKVVREETSHLPSKDEFYEEMGKLYKRQNDQEEEIDLLNHRVSKHTDHIDTISKHLNLSIED
ncbi:MAG: hypothetical protein US96_C0008G0016 [Candidatus Woesebacteria bacterium GW2011_GWB1_38_5b]|uniref:Uncharacterized protein n=1 Tax=Candidatus Woesebacteria bacterium GW2011_GWB1_38_5b TaxID=1618569 RepID=A0A0G0KJF0_9BACT|nr:MAG: hypothetical protein US96_C0008G0016 [Candidatus Woesebacteria bacterium GW2011_GWB1_38_5b]